MSNTWFRFKQFTIEQEFTAMKVGTDGVLLGAWASLPGPRSRVLDIGTGTGLLALMMAQRDPGARVDALEIEPSAAVQAKENFKNSPWKERLNCIPASLQDYASSCDCRYDLIICNPPFFSASAKTSSREKNLARHDDSLSLEDLFRYAFRLMKKKATLSLVLPAEKEVRVLDLIAEYQLYCRRLTRVIPTPGKAAHRILLECSFISGTCLEDELTIENGRRHAYSDEFKRLTDEFYPGEGTESIRKHPAR